MAKVIAIVTVVVLAFTGHARAEDKIEEAKLHVKSGMELYDENNFRAALVEFQRAYELAPSYKLLFNIGQVYMELQDYAGALKAFTRYLKEGGPDVPADRVTQVNADIDRLKGRVGSITVQTSAGAEVAIDDVSVGYAPLPEPIPVNAGQHKVTVHQPGREAVTRVYDVAGRQEITAALGLDAPTTTIAPAKPEPPPPPKAKSKTPIYVSWGITGALGVGAAVFSVLAYKASSDVADLRGSYPVTRDQLDDAKDKAVRTAYIADGLIAATVISAGIATYFTFTRRDSGHEERKTVRVEAGPGSIAISGTF
jgi:hypothetical protein